MGISIVQLIVCKHIIFKQNRVGKGGKIFSIKKFQTLVKSSSFKSNKSRISIWGQFLRVNSLDELPQLLNILKGDMNFIGPRPLLPEYLPLYSYYQARRHEVKPGLTGWAQVNGRNNLSWKEQFDLDVWYVDNQTFWLDVKIVALTFRNLLRSNKGESHMREAFNGKN